MRVSVKRTLCKTWQTVQTKPLEGRNVWQKHRGAKVLKKGMYQWRKARGPASVFQDHNLQRTIHESSSLGDKLDSVSVQLSSVAQSCPTLWEPMNRNMPGLPVHHQLPELLKLMPIESVMPSSHLILCRPLLLLPAIPPSIRVFSNESTLRMRWPKYWSFSFNICPSNEHPGLISFRMDWLDLLPVSRVFSNTTVQKHQFFGTLLSSQSNSHIHTWLLGKPQLWLENLFVKGMSLLFNMLSRFYSVRPQ